MPVETTTPCAAAVNGHRARVGHVAAVAERQPWIVEGVDRLLGGLRFACERGFVDGEVDRLRQPGVGGNPIARAQHHHVAGDQVARRNDGLLTVAKHARGRRRHLPQRFERAARAVFLKEAEQHGKQHDDGDDDRLERVAQESGNDGCARGE